MEIKGSDSYNKFAFDVQMKFLELRFKREKMCKQDKHYFIDRSIFEDKFIFAQNIKNCGMITAEEFDQYLKVFKEEESKIKPLNILIYLKSDPEILMERIRKRGREMEKGISLKYLKDLELLYEQSFFKNFENNFGRDVELLSYECDELSKEELRDRVLRDLNENFIFE